MTVFGKEYMLRGGALVQVKPIGESFPDLVPGNRQLWLVKGMGIYCPSDEDASDDGYLPFENGQETVFLLSATDLAEATGLHISNLGRDHDDYDGSHWTIEHVGVDARVDTTNKFLLHI